MRCMLRFTFSALNFTNVYLLILCGDIETEPHLFFHCKCHGSALAALLIVFVLFVLIMILTNSFNFWCKLIFCACVCLVCQFCWFKLLLQVFAL